MRVECSRLRWPPCNWSSSCTTSWSLSRPQSRRWPPCSPALPAGPVCLAKGSTDSVWAGFTDSSSPTSGNSQEATAQAVRATHAASQAHYPGHGLHFNCWFQAAVVILRPACMPNSWNLLQCCRQPETLGMELELVEPPSPAQWHNHNCTSQSSSRSCKQTQVKSRPGLRLLGYRLYGLGVSGLHGLHCSRWQCHWRLFPNL